MISVIGYEDYFQVTGDGQVWSKRTEKFLKQIISKTEYYTISTRIGGRKGVCKCFRVHRLVAEAYIENPENKPFVNHIDDNKLNNYVSNLEWCTSKENTLHAINTGLFNHDQSKSELSPSAKLTNTQVKQIRKEFKNHTFKSKTEFCLHYAKLYRLHKTSILEVVNYKSYKEV